MKKLVLLFFLSICSLSGIQAQDIILKTNGDEIKAVVTEVGIDEIKYKKFENADGPVYVMLIHDIFMIKYQNGEKDVFGLPQDTPSQSYQHEPYPAQSQYPQYYNRKSPGIAFFWSFIISGGGQYYNGQYIKGAIMTTVAITSFAGMITSASNNADDYYEDYRRGSNSWNWAVFFAFIFVGNKIWSLIDAPVSANDINKKNGFLSFNLNKNVNMALQPDVRTSSFGLSTSQTPVYGAKLSFRLK